VSTTNGNFTTKGDSNSQNSRPSVRSTSCSTPLVNQLQIQGATGLSTTTSYRFMHPPPVSTACTQRIITLKRIADAPWSGRQQQGCGDDGDGEAEVDLHMGCICCSLVVKAVELWYR
jgi:hypothetical protein